MEGVGVRMPHARPEKFLCGPFYFTGTVTAGVISLNLQTGANLTDPGLRKEFTSSETTAFANSPNLVLHIESWSLILADVGGNYSTAQMLELMAKTMLQTTIKDRARTYTLGLNVETVGQTVGTSTTVNNTTVDRRTMMSRGRALSRPIQVDLRSDQINLATQSAITGPPTDTTFALQLEGGAWDPNQFDNATMSEAGWGGETNDKNHLGNLKKRIHGISSYVGLKAVR
jgi:hypothetical protein